MKFKTIFKKLNPKKYDKKSALNDRISPTSPSPASSPNTTSPVNYKPIDFPQRKTSSVFQGYPNNHFNIYGRKYSASTISSSSLPTSFPPVPYVVQPTKQNEVTEINQESLDYSQVSTIPSPSRRESYITSRRSSQKVINQENIDINEFRKNSIGKIHGANEFFGVKSLENSNNTTTLINSNDEVMTSFPSKRSNSPNDHSNTLNPLLMALHKDKDENRQEKNDEILEYIDNQNENLAVDGYFESPYPETQTYENNNTLMRTISTKPHSQPHSPLSPSLSISSKKKTHSIFGYLKKKDKKKDKEFKTVFKNFSVMDTQSIEHEGLIIVDNQNNALHSLWEQCNSDLMKRNSTINKNSVVPPLSPLSTAKSLNNEKIVPPLSPLSTAKSLNNEKISTSPISTPLNYEKVSNPHNSQSNYHKSLERKSTSPFISPINEKNCMNISPLSSPSNQEILNLNLIQSSLNNKKISSSPLHSPKNANRISVNSRYITGNNERISSSYSSPINQHMNYERISPLNSPLNHKRISPLNSPLSHERMSLFSLSNERVSPNLYNSPGNSEKKNSQLNSLKDESQNGINTIRPPRSQSINSQQRNFSYYNGVVNHSPSPSTPKYPINSIATSPRYKIYMKESNDNKPNVDLLDDTMNSQQCNSEVSYSLSMLKSQVNPYATSPRYRVYMMNNNNNDDNKTNADFNTINSINYNNKSRINSLKGKPSVPGRNDSLFNNLTVNIQNKPLSHQSSTSHPLVEMSKSDLLLNNKNNNNSRTSLRINTNVPVRIVHSPVNNKPQISPNGYSLKLTTSPLPPLRTRKSPALSYTKLSSPISPTSNVSSEDILKENVGQTDISTNNNSLSKNKNNILNSNIEKEQSKECISLKVSETEKESVLAKYLEERTEEESTIISFIEKPSEPETEIIEKKEKSFKNLKEDTTEKEELTKDSKEKTIEKEELTEDSKEKTIEKEELTEDSKVKIIENELINNSKEKIIEKEVLSENSKEIIEENVNVVKTIDVQIENSLCDELSDDTIKTIPEPSIHSMNTENAGSVKSKISTLSKISNNVKTSLKSFAKSLGDKDNIYENTDISRISKRSSITSFTSNNSDDSSISDLFSTTITKCPVTEEAQCSNPANQDEAIRYNIENMKPIKIIKESKNSNLGKRTSGILKNRSSYSILKNKSSFNKLKNRNSGSIYSIYSGSIDAFPIKLDEMPSKKLKNKISIESKKSKVSFCEDKNIYRNITIDRKDSSKLKRISNSSIIPYIVEKSLNQTTILNESSIKFDNYSTTESFSILKGNFNEDDESMNGNIGFSDNEYNTDIPAEPYFYQIHNMPSISSINFSYDSEIDAVVSDLTKEKIQIFDQQLLNNKTNSSATFYHNSHEDTMNKRQSSNNTYHNEDEEISNFFESQSDNRTSFIVIGKDDDVLKENSLVDKNTKGNTLYNDKTNNKDSYSNRLKKNNQLLSNSESLNSTSSVNAIRNFPQNGKDFKYTPSCSSSIITNISTNTNNINNSINKKNDKKETKPLYSDHISIKTRYSEPCEKLDININDSITMVKKDKSFKSTGDIDSVNNIDIDLLDLKLDLNLNFDLKDEICNSINLEKNEEIKNNYEFSSLEIEDSPNELKDLNINKKESKNLSSPLSPTNINTNNSIKAKKNNTDDLNFSSIKKLIQNKKNSDESSSSSSQSDSKSNEDGEKSNHIKFNNKEIRKIKNQKRESNDYNKNEINNENQETVKRSFSKQSRSSKLEFPFRRSSSKQSKDNKNDFPSRNSSVVTTASKTKNDNVLRRSSTKRSVNDYSKTVQDCIQQLAPAFKNFDSQFSPSKETQKSECQFEKKISYENKKESHLFTDIKKSTVLGKDDIFKSKKTNEISKIKFTPMKIALPSKTDNNASEEPLTIVVGNQEVTHYNYKSFSAKSNSVAVVSGQYSTHKDLNKSTHKSFVEGTTLVNSDRYSKNFQKSKLVGCSTLVNSEENPSFYPSKIIQSSKIIKEKRKPASLLPRNESLKILKDQYPKESINADEIVAAKCVEINGKKSIKSERINTNEIKGKTPQHKKYQSSPVKSSKPALCDDSTNKTKSVDINTMTFSRRTSSLINPTSVPSPLLYNKNILRVKREGLPHRKRISHRSITKKTSQSSSLKISSILNEEQIMAKKSWETKDDESINTNRHASHRTRSRSFGPGDLSKYYMVALANVMFNNGNSKALFESPSYNKSNQEILKELNDNGVISFRRNSVDQYANNDITSPIFEKINGLTNLEFIELYLDIVQRNLSIDELLQRISK
ncbi:hypothetical protein BCR36DRAFT_163594 [Piromyces finnis]|uniref:Uncharacterized protein n=1 Tax=Piromyces finnis TaxID=1754191 RepID=A0A1Y1VJK0_9FUNG|nr:hypothetical protein BCR36DRAFT_163594 [Piromyces finnis]|eukprot:ORX56576.1 hypothetical protein BCR36DRAFT_163594 [Piromyces finnis]